MKKVFMFLFLLLCVKFTLLCQSPDAFSPGGTNSLRAPAYPLITMDPYVSTWSFTDRLYDENPRHWTGTARQFIGAIRVDGNVYRFMGIDEVPIIPVIYPGDIENWDGRYTEEKPSEGWEKPAFDNSQWKEGKAPYAMRTPPPSTRWRSKDIWVRREFNLPSDIPTSELMLKYSYDDFAEIFINGIPVISTDSTGKINQLLKLTDVVRNSLKPGKNIITAHAHNESGMSMLDFGIVKKADYKISFPRAAVQKSVNLLPTQTWYTFDCGPVEMELIFTCPFLPDDLYLFSRPVNYVTWQVKSNDSKSHSVQVYIEATPEWAVNSISQPVKSERFTEGGMTFLKTGTIEQPVLGKKGDDLRIDWGYLYFAGKMEKATTMSVGDPEVLKAEFIKRGRLSDNIGNNLQGKMYLKMTALSAVNDLGKVGNKPVSGYIMIGYDDIYSLQYFGDNLLAWWRKGGTVDIKQAFSMAAAEYQSLMKKCSAFDKELMADAAKAGGKKYSELCALVYRQSAAAHKLVATRDGEILFLSKENFSNGCINTVDVTFPSSPMYLVYNPDLLKGMMNGIFYYSESGKWTKPFASHDLGTYPLANGQVYREDMPVEEAGNMLILATAISVVEGNAKYAEKHWTTLSTWANYLLENGLDPANQLTSEDMSGHLAHSTNLSVKAILGISGYGKMAGMLGKNDIAARYDRKARQMATEWVKMAKYADHYKLAFDQPESWGQKYNLPWNTMLGLNVFPPEVAKTEIQFYLTKQMKYGMPLDSRNTYTINYDNMWSAVAADNVEDFGKLIDPIWKYVNETPTRIPLSDWHETSNGKSIGMRARSTVGGYFMKVLEQKISGNTFKQ
jgi:Domain of unknown function (DUF4965)/Domain of unknown function (DUF5127)/Domain of unknown function (DUF1793)/Domain of unknown function (DUF4964)